MFDFGFSELLVCAVVGLVVLGPERLPTVAKAAGQWIGKAQRFVQQMKDDFNRESELAELKKIKDDAENVARDLNETVQNAAKGIENDVNAVAGEAEKNLSDSEKAFEQKPDSADSSESPLAVDSSAGSDSDSGTGVEDYSATEYDSEDFSWDDSESSGTKIFDKRYISGPSIDELVRTVQEFTASQALQ